MTSETKGKVFVSYSRKDRVAAERLVVHLRLQGFTTLRDLDDILPTEDWQSRLEELIVKADSVVFLLSPSSAASEVCAWEVDLASSLNKKIAPIVIEDVAGATIPPMLARLNYIFATESDRFDNAVRSLCDALSLDIVWIREHSRLLDFARRWDKAGKHRAELLQGTAVNAAQKWRLSRPESAPPVSSLVGAFIESSLALEEQKTGYDLAKLSALTETVEPLLLKRVQELEEIAKERDSQIRSGPMVRMSADAADHRLESQTLENFLADNGMWHPQKAEHYKTGDASTDYIEVYQFPCCDKFVTRRDPGLPSQFRADGCSRDPREPA